MLSSERQFLLVALFSPGWSSLPFRLQAQYGPWERVKFHLVRVFSNASLIIQVIIMWSWFELTVEVLYALNIRDENQKQAKIWNLFLETKMPRHWIYNSVLQPNIIRALSFLLKFRLISKPQFLSTKSLKSWILKKTWKFSHLKYLSFW